MGVVKGSPKYPESFRTDGQISIQIRVPSHANEGEGQEVTQNLVEF